MSLIEVLSERREALASAWFECIVNRYPQETASFLRRQRDAFANPVGAGLREALGPLVDSLVDGLEQERVEAALDRILRVRAVQEMPPSAAVSFVLELKRLVRAHLDLGDGHPNVDELSELDDRVERLLLAAFDVYSRCREQVCEIRVRAIHNRSLKVMERMNAWRARREGDGESGAPTSDG
jgi:hypothetical protein